MVLNVKFEFGNFFFKDKYKLTVSIGTIQLIYTYSNYEPAYLLFQDLLEKS